MLLKFGKTFGLLLVLGLLIAACGGGDGDNKTPQPTDAPSATPTLEGPARVRVTVEEAPVFAEPSTSSTVIINLFAGDLRRILAKSEPDMVGLVYYQIDLGNREGWVAQTQVEVIGDASAIVSIVPTAIIPTNPPPTATQTPQPITPTTTPTATTPSTPVVRVNVSRAVVFAEPSREAQTLVTLFEGEQYEVVSISAPNAIGDVFYEIGLGDQRGWILRSQVNLMGDESLLAVVNPSDATSTAPTALADNPTPTALPTFPSSDGGTPEGTPSITPTPLATSDSPFEIRPFEPPPLTIELPEGWDEEHVLVPVASQLAAGNVPVSVYEGPLGEGLTGTIWVVWGFPNIVNPLGEFDLWADGLQYLRGLLFNGCNVGIDTKRNYDAGGEQGVGTIFSAVACPEGDDVAGYFVALQNQGGNYAFYAVVQPTDRVTEGLTTLQNIIANIEFDERTE